MIVLSGLTFGYPRSAPVVADLDAVFVPGTMTGLVGRSGSGKSTLLYLIGMMLTPQAGKIEVDGVDTVGLRDWVRADLRARLIGFVFQDAMLDPARSILDNVAEGALYTGADQAATRQEALQLLDQFDVEVEPDRLPGQISGGQAQRVALCRAFVRRPRIVLADEPTGNLDDSTAEVVWNALRVAAAGGAVVVVATHDRRRAGRCDVVMEIGRAAAA